MRSNNIRTRRVLPYFHILGCIAVFALLACGFATTSPYISHFPNQSGEVIAYSLVAFVPSFSGVVASLAIRKRLFSTKEDYRSKFTKFKELLVRLIAGISGLINCTGIYYYLALASPSRSSNPLYDSSHLIIYGGLCSIFFFIGLLAATATSKLVPITFWLKAALIINIPLFLINPNLPFYSIVFFLPVVLGLGGKHINNAFLARGHDGFHSVLILVSSCWFGIGLGAFLKLGKMNLFSYVSIFGLGGFLLLVFLIDIVKHWRR